MYSSIEDLMVGKNNMCVFESESERHKSSIEKWTLYLSTKQND